MPGHDGSRKRGGWRAAKRVRVAKAASPVQAEPITTTYDYGDTLTTTVDVLGCITAANCSDPMVERLQGSYEARP